MPILIIFIGHSPFFSHMTYCCEPLASFHFLLGFMIPNPLNYLNKRNTDKTPASPLVYLNFLKLYRLTDTVLPQLGHHIQTSSLKLKGVQS